MKQTDYAWVAGFLDGEGYFQATKTQIVKRLNGKYGVKAYSYFKITACQSDTRVLERLMSIIGGSFSGPYEYPPSKPYWSFCLCSDAQGTLKKIFKYLSPVKRAQAKKAIALVKSRNRLLRGSL